MQEEKKSHDEELMGRTIFKTPRDVDGWMGLNLRPVKVWDVSTFNQWASLHANQGKTTTDYQNYLKKAKKHQMTPGSAAGKALMLKGFKEFSLPGCGTIPTTDDFIYDLKIVCESASPIFHSLTSSFSLWCTQQNVDPAIQSFDVFMNNIYQQYDLPVAGFSMNLMHRILNGPVVQEWERENDEVIMTDFFQEINFNVTK